MGSEIMRLCVRNALRLLAIIVYVLCAGNAHVEAALVMEPNPIDTVSQLSASWEWDEFDGEVHYNGTVDGLDNWEVVFDITSYQDDYWSFKWWVSHTARPHTELADGEEWKGEVYVLKEWNEEFINLIPAGKWWESRSHPPHTDFYTDFYIHRKIDYIDILGLPLAVQSTTITLKSFHTPLPSALVLLGFGLTVLGGARRWTQQENQPPPSSPTFHPAPPGFGAQGRSGSPPIRGGPWQN